ncbi:protein translocase subunit SecD [Botrimarina mediterranea]|uniref:Multifunctional fusion protein n=1 Tax=Botrimarina mediterranea TaxID=2528022 RepID=A0A518KCG5_9BACT|nr:protein translocase subunit SecD [Botrimarina mediterranea]QDV75468.1 bifunctional preprotein translocase subunit SecD/SecF [Botrimarina mediterranea]QDV80101.1 bifunctional preprotein translocase subunit SecD/SecF [Planctomycetes bacterium K2D]
MSIPTHDLTGRNQLTRRTGSLGWLLASLTLALVAMAPVVAQESETPAAPAAQEAEAPAEEAAEAPTADDALAPDAEVTSEEEMEAGDAAISAVPDGAEPAPAGKGVPSSPSANSDDSPAAGAIDEVASDAAAAASTERILGVLATLAAIIVPIVLGNWLAKKWRMPEQAWRLAIIFTVFSVAALTVATGQFKGGPDLAGGITLVYELADTSGAAPASGDVAPVEANALDTEADEETRGETDTDDAEAESTETSPQRKVDIDKLIDALAQRIDPAGTKEVSIRNYGGAIEIIIPKAGDSDLEYIKRRITDLGQLEFRIVADPRWTEDRSIIEKAQLLGPSEKLVVLNDKPVAEWVEYNEKEFGEDDSRLVQRTAGSRKEALVLLDRHNVTGEFLRNASKSYDEIGAPIVIFNFDTIGSRKFGRFTGENLENPSTGVKRFLGILLDKNLLSAPSLNDRITSSGQISIGSGADAEKEVDYIVGILNAGSLPAALNKTPISEETISPTLGATTIQKGKYAITVSLVGILVFMVLYYRFAGVMACFALLGMLLLVLASMVLMQAAFTLPGIAGIVLTIGMAVDANVLIYERMREEMKKGASLRMAIRNGFDKAFSSIFDANVTSLIAAVVLYSVGTGPIKGFGVTMFLGILMSMFTAVFCSRTFFDIAERRRWIKKLSFGSMIGETNFDFIGKAIPAMVLSLVVIGIGLAGVFGRGTNLLDIDFTGGSSVTMVLKQDEAMSIAEVTEALTPELGDKNLLVVARTDDDNVEAAPQNRYTISTNVDDVDAVEALIVELFGDKLQTFDVQLGEPEAYTEAGGSTGTLLPLVFNEGQGFGENDGLAHDALVAQLKDILAAQGRSGIAPQVENDDYTSGSGQRFKDWTLRLPLSEEETTAVAQTLQSDLADEPLFPLTSKIGGRVASDLQSKAIWSTVLTLIGITAYLWFRFQSVAYGLAAALALVHDVLVTLGAIALSSWVVQSVPALATALQVDSFQISLTILAAFITIIGYSLNDTIVIFDRIREIKGKSPRVTKDIINKAINQTLSRTILTAVTTLIVVVILYFFGGAGIHAFAFAMVIGVIAGTYSTVFIATPALLWMIGGGDGTKTAAGNSPRKAA